MQQLQPLGCQSAAEARDASDVGARFVEAFDEARPDRIGAADKHDRDSRRRGPNGRHGKIIADDHRHPATHQICRQRWQPAEIVVRKAKLDGDVLALDEPRLGKALAKRRYQMHRGGGRRAAENTDHRHRRLLRARRQRPRRCSAAE